MLKGSLKRRGLLMGTAALTATVLARLNEVRTVLAAPISGDSNNTNLAVSGMNSADGRGVYGSSSSGTGVRGDGGYWGVEGHSIGGVGVQGIAESGSGQNIGVLGYAA